MSINDKIPILIVSYLFPPRGGVGVQRITKFVKYLPENGFQPIVLTVQKPGGSVSQDETTLDEIPRDVHVIRTKSFEPYHIYRALGGKRSQDAPSFRGELVAGGTKRGLLSRLYFEYQRRYLIPDPKIGWFKPALKAADGIFDKYSPKIILSTSPEATAHLIALKLSKKFKVPFIADFRDPWISGFYSLNRLKRALEKDVALEREVLENAESVIVVMKSYIDGFLKNHPDINPEKFRIIPNGFDESDYENLQPGEFTKFTLAHTGSIYHQRSPVPLFEAVKVFLENNPDAKDKFNLLLMGKIDTSFLKIAEGMGISENITIEEFSSHYDALSVQLGADALLILSEGMMTAKIYEYLRAKKPIIGIAPKGELHHQIDDWGIGRAFEPKQVSEIAQFIENLYDNWSKKLHPIMTDFKTVDLKKYQRSYQAKQLAEILHSVLPDDVL